MFIKIDSADVAKQLFDCGFRYTVEMVNKKKFYCFEQTPELASIIMNKFADVRLIVDDHLRF